MEISSSSSSSSLIKFKRPSFNSTKSLPFIFNTTTIDNTTTTNNNTNKTRQMSLPQTATAEDSLKSYHLVEALRIGDINVLEPLLLSYKDELPIRRGSIVDETTISTTSTTTTTEGIKFISTPLHLAVKCSKFSTIEYVLKKLPSFVNSQDSSGKTPLHLAASLNRSDVVALFLNCDLIDDTIKDNTGRTPAEIGVNSDIAGLFSMSKANYNETYLTLLATYIASPSIESIPSTSTSTTTSTINTISNHTRNLSSHLPHISNSSPKIPVSVSPTLTSTPSTSTSTTTPISAASGHVSNEAAEKLYHFIAKSRSRSLDFSLKDGVSGSTILHEAARRKDLGIIKLVVMRGGDVLTRDRKGKLAVDVAKDDRIKSMLRQTATSEGKALKANSSSSSSNTIPSSNITQPPTMKGYLSKWTNMARGYRSRWFVLDNGTLSYYRSQEDEGKASRGAISMSVASVNPPGDDKLKFEVSNKLGKAFPSFFLKGLHPVEVMRWVEVLRQNIEFARDIQSINRASSNGSNYAGSISSYNDNRRASMAIFSHPSAETSTSTTFNSEAFGDRDGSIIGDDETFSGEEEGVPRAEDFDLLGNSTKNQLELSQQLLESLMHSDPSTSTSTSTTESNEKDVKVALKESLNSLTSMIQEYVDVVAQRERFFIRKYEREIDAKRLWEENMKEIAMSHEAMEVELSKVARDNNRRKKALQEVRANLVSTTTPTSTTPSLVAEDQLNEFPLETTSTSTTTPTTTTTSTTEIPSIPRTSTSSSMTNVRLSTISIDSSRSRSRSGSTSNPILNSPTTVTNLRGIGSRLRSGTMHTLNSSELEQLVDSALIGEASEDSNEEDEEEFFEAIDSNTLPLDSPLSPLTIINNESGTTGIGTGGSGIIRSEPAENYLKGIDLEPYEGYKHLRTKLPIDDDNRPPTSLWSILKSSIGKDLTKISFPVAFNEPTSMLEVYLEFSECLDSAAASDDPTMRIAFVAAFAMSNYSSTVGRIAKPFNPMLGETFEYVNLEKKYRYISEQVVHHPPISACIAQAPSWEYYGEVDAKNKFLGKSFEIRPTGIAHVNLRLPKEVAPNYPPVPHIPNLVMEHYSWTKVTTSVSNFLFGNPIIDHYGDMIITNHRTGHTCTLTFKPRGWRGSGACEIKGKVLDAEGKEFWDIAGRWNSQLVARKVGSGTGDLSVDASVPTNTTGRDGLPTYVRLWQNSEKPTGVPFNLSPFAITLNDTNPEIKAWLPPTDCRLRPDQHAFEHGLYDKANDLKIELEDYQRATRRKREKGELPEHVSRWFTRKKDKDTNETYWSPATLSDGSLEYWEERKRVGKAKKEGKEESWKGVSPIFGDFVV